MSGKTTKNPAWTEEEMILALDVYFKLSPNQLHKQTRRVLDLSVLLNHLDVHGVASTSKNFRNPTGVAMILQNIAGIDPSVNRKGLSNASKLARTMFQKYHMQQETLHKIAWEIKDSIRDPMIRYGLYRYGEDHGGELSNFVHQEYERLSNMLEVKKEIAESRNEVLCEICALDFCRTYGDRAEAAMSCHHDQEILRLDQVSETSVADWSLVCHNCHSVMHEYPIWLTVQQMKELVVQA